MFEIISIYLMALSCLHTLTTNLAMAEDAPNPCHLPLSEMVSPKTGKPYRENDLLITQPGVYQRFRNRYIVGDFNSVGKDGYCKGVTEQFPTLDSLAEFPNLRTTAEALSITPAQVAASTAAELRVAHASKLPTGLNETDLDLEIQEFKNYQKQVSRFQVRPLNRPRVFQGYCIGQTLSMCELRDGKPFEVARFITSSAKEIPNRFYYPEVNYIRTRHWSTDRPYTEIDRQRDIRMGGGDSKVLYFKDQWEMPNFMNFWPFRGYTGGTGNGIHEIAGGLDTGGQFGAPVSLGCIRLRDFPSKFARWWTPMGARFFMHFDKDHYKRLGNPSTGRPL